MFTHILLEVYCGAQHNNYDAAATNYSCEYHCIPSYACIERKCPYVVFTSCENAMCYIGEASTAEELICFGGDMRKNNSVDCCSSLDLWKTIALQKIGEAYDEYMRRQEGQTNY